MKIENFVIDVATSKVLKEMGIPQDALHYWVNMNDQWFIERAVVAKATKNVFSYELVAAFTAGEILELLPKQIAEECCLYVTRLSNVDDWGAGYRVPEEYDSRVLTMTFFESTPHRALARLLIWAKENGFYVGKTDE